LKTHWRETDVNFEAVRGNTSPLYIICGIGRESPIFNMGRMQLIDDFLGFIDS